MMDVSLDWISPASRCGILLFVLVAALVAIECALYWAAQAFGLGGWAGPLASLAWFVGCLQGQAGATRSMSGMGQ